MAKCKFIPATEIQTANNLSEHPTNGIFQNQHKFSLCPTLVACNVSLCVSACIHSLARLVSWSVGGSRVFYSISMCSEQTLFSQDEPQNVRMHGRKSFLKIINKENRHGKRKAQKVIRMKFIGDHFFDCCWLKFLHDRKNHLTFWLHLARWFFMMIIIDIVFYGIGFFVGLFAKT